SPLIIAIAYCLPSCTNSGIASFLPFFHRRTHVNLGARAIKMESAAGLNPPLIVCPIAIQVDYQSYDLVRV
ncbi:MAG: hypothetical protein V7K47_02705, partial [Nostoc sp.]